MRIGIFGGTFNPIHFGHLVLAEQSFESLQLDKVIFVPSFNPPHKNASHIVSAKHRYHMVKEAIKGNAHFEVSDIEIKRGGNSYLIDTLREFRSIYQNAQMFFLSGSDVSTQIKRWKSIDEVLRLARFILAKRPKYKPAKYHKSIKIIPITELDISSSLIRQKIHFNKSVEYLMPESVIRYIEKNGLYK